MNGRFDTNTTVCCLCFIDYNMHTSDVCEYILTQNRWKNLGDKR